MGWVIVEGGLVSDYSRDVQVFNLDFMDDHGHFDSPVDQYTLEEARDVLDRMETYAPDLADDAQSVRDWIKRHTPTEEPA